MTKIDPARRRIGYVPQDYALLPFKNVWQNVSFGLEVMSLTPEEKKKRVHDMLTLLGISHLSERYPGHLSGGEKQRVALGRALAIRPEILLLDEPLSAVDEKTGDQLMRQLKGLHQRLNVTILHICHRLEEAFYLADRLCVIHEGKIVQIGAPEEIYKNPASTFVATLFRMKNIVQGYIKKVENEKWLHLAEKPVKKSTLPPGPVNTVIFPQTIVLYRHKPEIDTDRFARFFCTVHKIDTWSVSPEIVLDAGFPVTIPHTAMAEAVANYEQVWAVIPLEAIHILPC